MPPEFIPGSIVLGFALFMALAAILLGRRELRRTEPAADDVPVSDFFADIEAVLEPAPEELPAHEAAGIHRDFAVIAAINPHLDRMFEAVLAEQRVLPKSKPNLPNPRTPEEDPT